MSTCSLPSSYADILLLVDRSSLTRMLKGIASTLITIRLGIVDVTEGRSVQNVKLSVRRASAYPRMFEEQYSLRRPPPSMSPIFEPREDSKESLITTGDPLRSSSATGFGQDLLLAVQRVLDLDGAPSYVLACRTYLLVAS